MNFYIEPYAKIWQQGVFTVPTPIVDKYLRMASGKQIKALVYILSHSGKATSASIAKALGVTSSDVDELMEFWMEEGVLLSGSHSASKDTSLPKAQAVTAQPKKQIKDKPELPEPQKMEQTPTLPKREILPAPRLSPKDIVAACRENKELDALVNEAQVVLSRTISTAEQEMLVNMVNYYGLPPEVVLMLLSYYRAEKEKGRSIGISYINKMADNWAEEGIDSAAAADKKLMEIEQSDKAWNDLVELTGIMHKTPTIKQRAMLATWNSDFSKDMIEAAANIMKENADKPSLPYMDSVLKKWKKNNITTLADVAKAQQEFEQSKERSKGNSTPTSKRKSTYDIDKIKQDMMNNTDL